MIVPWVCTFLYRSGKSGIQTHGTLKSVRRISSPVHSITLASFLSSAKVIKIFHIQKNGPVKEPSFCVNIIFL